jgi:hypothetical protein
MVFLLCLFVIRIRLCDDPSASGQRGLQFHRIAKVILEIEMHFS